jgi:hypothetical protein
MVDSEDAAAVLRLKEDLAPLANANALAADALRTDSAAPGVLADNFTVYAAATYLPAAITVYAICLYIHKQTHEVRGLALLCSFTPLYFVQLLFFASLPPFTFPL